MVHKPNKRAGKRYRGKTKEKFPKKALTKHTRKMRRKISNDAHEILQMLSCKPNCCFSKNKSSK